MKMKSKPHAFHVDDPFFPAGKIPFQIVFSVWVTFAERKGSLLPSAEAQYGTDCGNAQMLACHQLLKRQFRNLFPISLPECQVRAALVDRPRMFLPTAKCRSQNQNRP
jgi:hypothetical protein